MVVLRIVPVPRRRGARALLSHPGARSAAWRLSSAPAAGAGPRLQGDLPDSTPGGRRPRLPWRTHHPPPGRNPSSSAADRPPGLTEGRKEGQGGVSARAGGRGRPSRRSWPPHPRAPIISVRGQPLRNGYNWVRRAAGVPERHPARQARRPRVCAVSAAQALAGDPDVQVAISNRP